MVDVLFCFHSCPNTHYPVFEVPRTQYSAERILEILFDPEIPETKICKAQPIGITSSSAYVVDLRQLSHVDDIKKDEFGIWKYSGQHPQSYRVFRDEDSLIQVEKCSRNASGVNVYHLRRNTVHILHLQSSSV